MKHPELMTERFILKTLVPELVGEDYLSWFSNPEASQYIYYAKKAVTLDELKTYVQEKLDSPEALFFGIYSKETGKHIGNIKYEPVNQQERYAVMGILIGDDSWRGKGVFSEIDSVLCTALKNLGMKKVYLGVDKANLPAVKAYMKVGYSVDESDFLKVEVKNSHTMMKEIV